MDIDTDMNNELMAHGYSNFAAGVFGSLPNYMTYSNSLLFAKSKGGGMASSLIVSFFTFVFFIFGPELAIYIPRCMAGTLLLHIGLDLFMEGVVDSYYYGYDRLEYGGIWLITITMTALGMTAGLCAGVLAALSVYAAQSITYMNPIRAQMPATTLLSSVWTRPASELAILNNERTGRSRILVVQLQGHLFFGNANQLTDTVKGLLTDSQGTGLEPLIVILDFTLVLGLDSSASHAVAKMNTAMHRRFDIAATVFVAGREGFPCEYALSEALSRQGDEEHLEELEDLTYSFSDMNSPKYRRNRICDNLDDALIFAEDVLIFRVDPSLLQRDRAIVEPTGYLAPEDERKLAVQQLANLFPKSDEITAAVKLLFSFFEREEYTVNQKLWEQGDASTCAKLLVRGELIAYSDCNAQTSVAAERVPTGNIVGELGLVQGLPRLSTLECTSEKAIMYSLSLESWKKIRKEHSYAAVYFEEIVIRYLANRAQHVTRIFDSRCLPV
ncbi:solute carrier family 26 [Seminavis robusta]|uniref:Solute carrier family 26 n=1 Tax=Seminavis robusta TaxID=568900 RepID=A0A9N8H8U2_9STRA|nr:solute carrier family 26 [Seminavis robusta]|eukprot:Sro100_g051090.1 solute carrier family 26 (499) ;mRNA; r:5643-7557